MRLIRICRDILVALFLTLSIGVGSGAVAASVTHRLDTGVRLGLASLLAAAMCFGYAIWRTYRAPRKPGQTPAAMPRLVPAE